MRRVSRSSGAEKTGLMVVTNDVYICIVCILWVLLRLPHCYNSALASAFRIIA